MTEQSRFTNHAAGIVHEPARDLYWTADDVTPKAVTYDKAVAAVAKLNADAFGGFTDWRLPSVEELFLLADRTKVQPAIDTAFFPSCKSEWYWSSTLDCESPNDYAWFVDFGGGGSGLDYRVLSYRVRAVRGSARQ
jgi:hypothetical protein